MTFTILRITMQYPHELFPRRLTRRVVFIGSALAVGWALGSLAAWVYLT